MKVKDYVSELLKLNQEHEIVLGNSGGYQYDIPVIINDAEEDCYIIQPTIY